MYKISFLIMSLFFLCCDSEKHSQSPKIENNGLSSIWINCKKQQYFSNIEDKEYQVSTNEYEEIVNAVNSAQKIGLSDSVQNSHFVKEGNSYCIRIMLKSNDTINLDLRTGIFIWEDFKYKTSLDSNFNKKLCIKCAENELRIDSLWNLLAFSKAGCLVGGQNVVNGRFGGEGCVLSSDIFWKGFFYRDKKDLTAFLIAKFSSTKETKIHVCPVNDALEGELAVYCLHKMYLKNWYDFADFKEDNKNLNKILRDERRRAILAGLWRKEMEKK